MVLAGLFKLCCESWFFRRAMLINLHPCICFASCDTDTWHSYYCFYFLSVVQCSSKNVEVTKPIPFLVIPPTEMSTPSVPSGSTTLMPFAKEPLAAVPPPNFNGVWTVGSVRQMSDYGKYKSCVPSGATAEYCICHRTKKVRWQHVLHSKEVASQGEIPLQTYARSRK